VAVGPMGILALLALLALLLLYLKEASERLFGWEVTAVSLRDLEQGLRGARAWADSALHSLRNEAYTVGYRLRVELSSLRDDLDKLLGKLRQSAIDHGLLEEEPPPPVWPPPSPKAAASPPAAAPLKPPPPPTMPLASSDEGDYVMPEPAKKLKPLVTLARQASDPPQPTVHMPPSPSPESPPPSYAWRHSGTPSWPDNAPTKAILQPVPLVD